MATIYPLTRTALLPERRTLTFEQVLYGLIFVLAILTHLVLLGSRALHHDETLHAEYSWRVYQGQGYLHDPLLHGPFLYYWTALTYFIFGDSDTTARLGAALFGIVAVMLPLLLRKELGRTGALLACGYFLISPVFLYVGRFIRHDIFAITFELLVVIGLMRYVDTERSRWLYLLAAALGLMLATMETFYLFVLIVGSYLVIKLIWDVAPRWLPVLLGYGVLVGFFLKGLPLLGLVGPLPLPTPEQALNVRNQPDSNWGAYFSKLGPVIGPLLRHPSVLLILLLTAVLAGFLGWALFWRRDTTGRTAWRRAADAAPQGTLVRAVDHVARRQWLMAFLIGFGIYAVFYTSLLSQPAQPNTTGLVTGVLGSFLYWLGQHDVRRGGQPAHYYLFLLAVYEPLLLICGSAGLVLVGRRMVRTLRLSRWGSGVAADAWSGLRAPTSFLPSFLAWWSISALAVYSWAGEKMPWLTIHLVVPLTLLSAWAFALLLRWALHKGIARTTWIMMGMAAVLIGPAILMLNITTVNAQRVTQVWFWPCLILLALGLLVIGASVLGGVRQGLLSALAALLLLLVPFTIRSSFRLSFINGDVPVEPLVYVQTSPDVLRTMEDLQRVSLIYGSKLDMPIRYDNETVWQWYFRNYTNTTGSGGEVLDGIDNDVQAVVILDENLQKNADKLDGFVQQRYPLRWWFPECEVYHLPSDVGGGLCDPKKSSMLSRFLSRPWDGAAISGMWQFWLNRRLPAPIGSSDFILLVRPEIAYQFGLGSDINP